MLAKIFKLKGTRNYMGLSFSYNDDIIALISEEYYISYDREYRSNIFNERFLDDVIEFCYSVFNKINNIKISDNVMNSIDFKYYASLNITPGASDALIEFAYEEAKKNSFGDKASLKVIELAYLKICILK